MSHSKASILVTGANGFVGSRLCRTFLQHDYHVVASVRRTADLSLLDDLDVEFRYGDLSSVEGLTPVVAGVDFVIHNAGVVKARRAETFFAVNDTGVKNVMEALQQRNPDVKKAILISSLAAAGPSADASPISEADEPRPITTYGKSKLAGERTALGYADRLHVVALRPPGIYGPGDKEIFSFFETVNKGIKPVVGDPDRKIQLVHVDDLCRAAVMAVEHNTVSGEAYFIAENRAYTMQELVTILAQASGKRGVWLKVPGSLFKLIAFFSEFAFRIVNATPMLTREKAGELLASWEIDTTKAKQTFGFESTIDFPQGARETFDWYRREGWLT